jgi:hypothetical protein
LVPYLPYAFRAGTFCQRVFARSIEPPGRLMNRADCTWHPTPKLWGQSQTSRRARVRMPEDGEACCTASMQHHSNYSGAEKCRIR